MAALLLLACGSPCLAQAPGGALTAEQAIGNSRARLRATTSLGCNGPQESETIIVCARQGPDPDRLPLPVEGETGQRIRLVAGEAAGAIAALTAERCIRLCYRPVMITLIRTKF